MGDIFDAYLAQQAVGFTKPLISMMMEGEITRTKHLHIVIMDPSREMSFGFVAFDQAILYEESIGVEHWEADYKKYAHGKAEMSWTYQKSSREVQQMRPFVYLENDVYYPGGICLDGLVVACSGVQSHFDEAFSGCIAYLCYALSAGRFKRETEDPKATGMIGVFND